MGFPAAQAVAIAMNFSAAGSDSVRNAWLPENDTWRYVDATYSRFEDILRRMVADVDTAGPGGCLAEVSSTYQNELTPLALVLARLVAEHAHVREHIFPLVYPGSTIDYALLPEDRPGTSAMLVRVMRIPLGGMLPSAIGDLLLALLGHDIKHFVMAVGYGNAAGYMVARGIPIPQDIIEQVKTSVGTSSMIDPVTGRHMDRDDIDRELAAMTDEEKEREAERLFVLFERLNKTGVIKVANPIRMAAESGRLEEVVDDSSDSSQ
ncbi:hypothetical protein LPJ61_002286 [Coemansia biformis]|uniref:Uncharacterized protein n=1 Tax=Coemansia biformis TaxID=1286918 RepID=A0A9W8CYT4_9FUNG|nr:hypothetical protein LPJ61_002286 [Coemansia biformis]